MPEFTWSLSAAQKIWRLLCVPSSTPRDTGLGRQPFSEYPQVHCVLRGCQRPASSLGRVWGLGGGAALPGLRVSGKEAGACSVVPEEKLLSDGMLVEAREASEEDLLVVHTRRYLNELKVQYRGWWAVARGSGWGRGGSALGVPPPVPSTGVSSA